MLCAHARSAGRNVRTVANGGRRDSARPNAGCEPIAAANASERKSRRRSFGDVGRSSALRLSPGLGRSPPSTGPRVTRIRLLPSQQPWPKLPWRRRGPRSGGDAVTNTSRPTTRCTSAHYGRRPIVVTLEANLIRFRLKGTRTSHTLTVMDAFLAAARATAAAAKLEQKKRRAEARRLRGN